MKHYLTIALSIIALIFVSTDSFSQTQNDLIGDWSVTKVIMPDNPKPQFKSKLDEFSNILLKSKFHFKSDSGFILDCPYKEMAIKTAKWKYDETRKIISVDGEAPQGMGKGSLMKMTIKIEQSIYFFHLDEMPFTLQMEKIEPPKN